MKPIALVLVTAALQWYLGYLPPLGDLVTFPGLAVALVPPIGVFLLYVLVAVIRAPVELDKGKEHAIDVLNDEKETLQQQITALRQQQVLSPEEQIQSRFCERALRKLEQQEPNARDLLCQILERGSLDERQIDQIGPRPTVEKFLVAAWNENLISSYGNLGTRHYGVKAQYRQHLAKLLN